MTWKPPSQKELQAVLREHKAAAEATGNEYGATFSALMHRIHIDKTGRLDAKDDSVFVCDDVTGRLIGSFLHERQAKAAIEKAADAVFGEREGGDANPANWTAGKINSTLDSLDKKSSRIGDEMIAVGRGYETSSETARLTDPLAMKWRENVEARMALYREIEMRMGPNAPTRLPKGRFFGPRKGRY